MCRYHCCVRAYVAACLCTHACICVPLYTCIGVAAIPSCAVDIADFWRLHFCNHGFINVVEMTQYSGLCISCSDLCISVRAGSPFPCCCGGCYTRGQEASRWAPVWCRWNWWLRSMSPPDAVSSDECILVESLAGEGEFLQDDLLPSSETSHDGGGCGLGVTWVRQKVVVYCRMMHSVWLFVGL